MDDTSRRPRVGDRGLDAERLPHPIGASPFRIKGSGYLLHLQYVDEHIPGGRQAMNAAIRTPELRAFFDQTFFAGHLFDIYPLVAVGHTCARLVGTSFERFIRLRSRHQAEGDLKLFRKMIVRVVSPEMLAARIPLIFASYFDFGTTEIVERETAAITGLVSGVPKDLAPWMSFVSDETVRFMLEYNGVKNLRSRIAFEPDGERDGIALVKIRSTLQWGDSIKPGPR